MARNAQLLAALLTLTLTAIPVAAQAQDKGDMDFEPEEISKSEPESQTLQRAKKLYDKGDYPGALEAALKILETDPSNLKMLRVAVSTKCALNEVEAAKSYLERLPRRDQRQMRIRCKNWGVDL